MDENSRTYEGTPQTRQETPTEIIERLMSACYDYVSEVELDLYRNPTIEPTGWTSLTRAYNNLYLRTEGIVTDPDLRVKVAPQACGLTACDIIKRYLHALRQLGFHDVGRNILSL